MRRPMIIAGLTVATALAGCTGVPGASGAPDSGSEEARSSMAAIGEVPGDLLEAVVADAADRAGVDPAAVDVVSAEAVTWSDGSIGCPEPGMMYTQALVPGYRVVVEVAGAQMTFHAAESGDFRFCENPELPVDVDPNE